MLQIDEAACNDDEADRKQDEDYDLQSSLAIDLHANQEVGHAIWDEGEECLPSSTHPMDTKDERQKNRNRQTDQCQRLGTLQDEGFDQHRYREDGGKSGNHHLNT